MKEKVGSGEEVKGKVWSEGESYGEVGCEAESEEVEKDSILTDSTGKLYMIQYNVTLYCDIVCII